MKTKNKKSKKTGKAAAKTVVKKMSRKEKPIGAVTHYYGKIKVAIVKFNKSVKVGEKVRFAGATTDFAQVIGSMQFDHKPIETAQPKKQIGIKVGKRVREGDALYKDK